MNTLKEQAIALRLKGFQYREIQETLGVAVPKGTLSGWFKGVVLDDAAKARLERVKISPLALNRRRAVAANKAIRAEYFARIRESNHYLLTECSCEVVNKVALTMLYLGEGAKNPRFGAVRFANSDPEVIKLFLKLFTNYYIIDEVKLRCTVQGRADQDPGSLIEYWSQVTSIPYDRFYPARLDKRTEGKPTLRTDYMGVCVVQYHSAPVLYDLLISADILMGH